MLVGSAPGGVTMVAYSRTPAQALAIRRYLDSGFNITTECPSKVEMRRGGQVVVIRMDGSVRRGESGHQKVVRRSL